MKRIIIILIIICLIIAAIFGVYYFLVQKREVGIIEYTPQEEISEEQMRQTIVSLYFKTGEELVPEARLIDVKQLLNNPYEEILKMLIEGPKNNNLEKTIPEETKINKIQKENDILIIDLSKEFIENHKGGEKEEKITINSILNTLTELTEINGIKILINGEENKEFKDGKINFKNVFNKIIKE
ncbi:MAG: GerMN domain-containing protein [Clostridia bacterium]|nr:GerMN domain-containing protein [Clostridia bacterium]